MVCIKTKEELVDDYMNRLHLLGEDFSPLETRRAFLAGYRTAMEELAKLPLDEAVAVIIYEAHREGI